MPISLKPDITEREPVSSVWVSGDIRRWVAFAVLILVCLLIWAPRLRGPINLRWDAGTYYVLGTSLAEGKGYRLLNEPGEIHAVQYPPVVPCLIALHQHIAGTSHPLTTGKLLKYSWFLMFLATVLLTFQLLSRYLSFWWAFAGGLLCATSFPLYFYASVATAEIPFALFSVICIIFSQRTSRTPSELLAGASAAAAYFTRTIGVTLLFAWTVEAFVDRRWKKALVRLCLSLCCIGLWQGYIRRIEKSPEFAAPAYSYQRAPYQFYNVTYAANMALRDPFRPDLGVATSADLLQRVGTNLLSLPPALGEAVSSHRGYWELQGLAVGGNSGLYSPIQTTVEIGLTLLGCVVLAGLCLLFFQRQFLPALYLAGTLGAVCTAPWPDQLVRYLTPVIPLVVLAFLTALSTPVRLGGQIRLRWRGVAPLVIIVLLLHNAITVPQALRFSKIPATMRDPSGQTVRYTELLFSPADAALEEAAEWLRTHAPPGSVVSAALPPSLYLRTNLKTVMPPLDRDADRVTQLLDSVPVGYLVFDDADTATNFPRPYLRHLLEARPGDWKLVFTPAQDQIRVYQRVRARSVP